MNKKIRNVCALMRHNTIFFMVLWQYTAAEGWLLRQTMTFSDEETLQAHVSPLLHHYGRSLHLRWVVHYDDYLSLLVQDNGLSGKALSKGLPYLLAEQCHIDVNDHLLIHFNSRHLGHVHVLAIPRVQLQRILPSWLREEQCSVIDSYDYSVASGVVAIYGDKQPMVLLQHNNGIIRCLLLNNDRLCSIQETSLLEENSKTPSEQLTHRLCHYFSDYREKAVLFIGLDSHLPIPHLPTPWSFCVWSEGKSAEIYESSYLPLMGSGLRYVNQ
ncbi:MAG: hypothetical protein LRY69_03945 [Gammaproteobacteria bacterium]|nr:hypothetical protein [Gammaproteobacteria bacterium]